VIKESKNFIFCSYTKAAAEEGLKRLGKQSGRPARTIHSLAYEHVGVDKGQVVTTQKLRELSAMTGYVISGGAMDSLSSESEVGDDMLAVINYADARMMAYDDGYVLLKPYSFGPYEFRMFHKAYTSWKNKWGYIDFNDMLKRYIDAKPIEIDVLFVDEAQDLSPLQWACIRNIKAKEIYIAGDDDQSIHSWAGSDPHGMGKFMDHHKATDITVLGQSYRLPKTVFNTANTVLNRIKVRHHKTFAPREEEGEVIRFNGMGWLDKWMHRENSVLMLYRNHSVRDQLEEYLIERAMPYTSPYIGPGKSSFYESQFIKAARAFIKLKNGEALKKNEIRYLRKHVDKVYLNGEGFNIDKIRRTDWRQAIHMPWNHLNYINKLKNINAEVKIKLCTIHAAKGAEADQVVLLTSMGTRTWENMSTDMDAELRVWYVGVTRAIKSLALIDIGLGMEI